ncbi:Na+/H+ antiporter subunit A [Oceanobacillus chungangensis]|uniref:Na+/H+ antiporter subunit A n=1 Tax=Oceanobacillus chungangensis TaxID=1229152 RepID=A0A3D8PMQ8_9BACI|nr:Na+/H+ antiporter subunit A [Oceanobacillus chungangensis]RDW17380.1 Na+/H+ antiporter subunit A [Oceanobacillus chungangensis]
MVSVNLLIMIPFLAAALIPFLHKRISRLHIGWYVLLIPIILFIFLALYIPSIASGATYLFMVNWLPTYGINFSTYLDGLSLIFGLIITGVGALVILYSIYYLNENESLEHFYAYLMLFMGAMLGVIFSDNIMVLYVFWELTSISSFLLIAFWFQRKRSREGAQKALLITVSGGFSMLAGFIMIGSITGSFSFREIIEIIPDFYDHHLFIPAMLLVLLGAFTKSAQFPFHIWLPSAMEAPTPVSAYLHSATMVNAGLYLVARFTPIFGGEVAWFWLVTGIGLVTMFWGSFTAVRQTDLKALLAYSTISQLGMIMSMFGMSSAALNNGYSTDSVVYTQAAFAGLFHLINHATFKSALFMVVGIIDHGVGTRDIRRLGGLATYMPITFTIAMIGSFSMAGLPPFNGFLSKEMFFTSVLNIRELNIYSLETWGTMLPVIAWVASVFTFIYCMIIVFKTFLGKYQEERLERPAHEAPVGMLIAPIILGILVIVIFFFPNVLGNYLIVPAMASIFPTFAAETDLGVTISAWHGFQPELWMTIGVVVFGVLLFISLKYWKGIYALLPESWSFDSLYNAILEKTEINSNKITNYYMTGYLRDYLVYIYIFFIILAGGTLIYTGALDFNIVDDAPIDPIDWVIAITMSVGAIAVIFAKSRLTAILLNGVIGYGVALFFVLLRAPDLALTQSVVETVTTVLFLVAYKFLPEWKKEDSPRRTKSVNLLISILVGTIFVTVALAVQNGKLFESISSYFENSYELAGAKNIVNAILSDFRGFDTMLEVIVLLIAGIGIFTLIKLKARKGEEELENK